MSEMFPIMLTNFNKEFCFNRLTTLFLSKNSVGSILRQSRFRRDPRQMDEDEEMWFNDDEDDFEASQNDVTQSIASASSDAKLKSCFVSLKACPSQNGPSADSDANGSDAKTSPKASKLGLEGENSPKGKIKISRLSL